jgi:2-haloalkanoic acid dehalogenase type II
VTDAGRRAALDTRRIELLTFDCYGTLIDWLGGVEAALRDIESLRGADLARLVRDRDEEDQRQVLGPYEPYGVKLGRSLRVAASRQGRQLSDAELERFVGSMERWRPFDETRVALERLGALFQLAVLSNVETRVLQASLAAIGAPVDFFVTAEEVHSYKPARAHFDAALERSQRDKSRVLHVAASLFHDVRPALQLGWNVAWIDREGQALDPDCKPQFVARNLLELCTRLGC